MSQFSEHKKCKCHGDFFYYIIRTKCKRHFLAITLVVLYNKITKNYISQHFLVLLGEFETL